MRGFFNMDSPFFVAMSRLADFIILNLLFIICCVPVITIGASLTAMSYVTLKMKEKEEGYISRSFFKSFKRNFKQATLLWLVMLVIAFVLYLDWRMIAVMGGTIQQVMRVVVIVGAIFWLMMLLYLFPMIARYENKSLTMVQNAIFISMANAPKALLMMLVVAACAALTLWNANTLIWGLLIWLLVGFAALSYLNSTLQIQIFHRIEPHDETEGKGETADEDVVFFPDDPEASSPAGAALTDEQGAPQTETQASAPADTEKAEDGTYRPV